MSRLCHRPIACLLLALWALPGPLPARANPAPGEAQRLHWRITELEGELAALRQFASQQDASIGLLQAQADASDSRARRALVTGAWLAMACGVAAGWAARRRPR